MLQFIVAGLVLGSIYALAASGLVVTYVSTGVLNFAFGSLAFVVARTYYYLHVERSWGILASAGMCLFVLSPALGLFLYLAIFRYLRMSSQLIKVVVTIGLSVVLPAVSNMIFGTEEIIVAPGLAPQPVSVYHVFGTAVTLDQVIAYACVLAIVVIGALVLRLTPVGLSVRAMVDSEAMTSLSGTNPARTAAGVWMVATFLAGLSGILAAPIINLDPNKFTLLIAAAFAAVIAARFRSLPIAVVVALLMGIAGSLVQYYLPPDSQFTADVVPSIPFVFIVLSLVYNILRTGRVSESDGVGGALDRAVVPHGSSRLAASVDTDNPYPRLNFFFPVVVFAGVCVLPLILKPYWLGLLAVAVTLAVAFLSITLVTGEGGMLWLCEITFTGVGAFTTAQLATKHGWPLLIAIVAGGMVASAMGVLIGLLTIRLGNLYIALVTLTFGLLMERLVFNLKTFANAGAGVSVARPDFAGSDRAFTYLVLAVFALLSILIVNLRRSTTGLALNAVRWSETASRTMGLSVLQMKLLVSGLAAFVAGIGGGFYASANQQAVPLNYVTLLGLVWLAVLVTFGVRSNIAALLAAVFFVMTPALIQTYVHSSVLQQLPVLLFGLGAIALATNPEGTVHAWALLTQRGLRNLTRSRPVTAAGAGGPDRDSGDGPVPAGAVVDASTPQPAAKVQS